MENDFSLFVIVLSGFLLAFLLMFLFSMKMQKTGTKTQKAETSYRITPVNNSIFDTYNEVLPENPAQALHEFTVYDMGIMVYTEDENVYLLRNFYQQSPVRFIRPFVEIGSFRTGTSTIEFQVLDEEEHILIRDKVRTMFLNYCKYGKKTIFTSNYFPVQQFNQQKFKLQILIYGLLLEEYRFTMKAVEVSTLRPDELVPGFDGELTGAVMAFFQKHFVDDMSIEELLNS